MDIETKKTAKSPEAADAVRVVVVPTGEAPREKRFDRRTMMKSLQEAVGGLVTVLDVFGNGAIVYCNDEGVFDCEPNRAVYMNRHMAEEGYLSQLDFRTVPPEGELYTIVFGDFVVTSWDPETGEDASLSDEQAAWALEEFADPTTGEYELGRMRMAKALGVSYYELDDELLMRAVAAWEGGEQDA